jgi:hypothetical protein
LFVCLFILRYWRSYPRQQKKTSDISLENAYQQNPRNPKVPKVRRDHDTPPAPQLPKRNILFLIFLGIQ